MLKAILNRIDKRLEALDLTESRAAKLAGLSDSSIRDMRRALKAGKEDAGVSSRTLIALAPVLNTSASWLLEGGGPERVPEEVQEIQDLLLRASEASPEVRARIVDFAEWQLQNYEKSRDTAA